jgi:hypothetical protein
MNIFEKLIELGEKADDFSFSWPDVHNRQVP